MVRVNVKVGVNVIMGVNVVVPLGVNLGMSVHAAEESKHNAISMMNRCFLI